MSSSPNEMPSYPNQMPSSPIEMNSSPNPFWKDHAFLASIAQVVAAVAAVVMLVIATWQLRMAYSEASDQRAEAEKQRAHNERVLKASSTPYLACDRNYRAIEVEFVENKGTHFENGKAKEVIGDPPRSARLSTRRLGPDDPPTTLIVKNFGTGPALNCTAKFVTVQFNVLSNSPGRIKESETTDCIVDPRNIMPGQVSHIQGMPECFDLRRDVFDAQGYIVFECEQLDGTKQEFKEPFDMWQGYAAKPYPRLSVRTWGPKSPWLERLPKN